MRTLNIAMAGSVVGLLAFTGSLTAQEPTVVPLMEKVLSNSQLVFFTMQSVVSFTTKISSTWE